MLKQVQELPPSAHCRGSYVEKDIRQFIRSGARFAELVYEGRKPGTVQKVATNYVARHGLKSKVMVASRMVDGEKHVYLVSVDAGR